MHSTGPRLGEGKRAVGCAAAAGARLAGGSSALPRFPCPLVSAVMSLTCSEQHVSSLGLCKIKMGMCELWFDRTGTELSHGSLESPLRRDHGKEQGLGTFPSTARGPKAALG